MVLRLHQHNIGYTADGFYRSDDPTNCIKAGWLVIQTGMIGMGLSIRSSLCLTPAGSEVTK